MDISLLCGHPHTIPYGGIGSLPSMTNAYPPPVYSIAGMTCDHCALAVREEVAEVLGVTSVDVDLASGRMTVAGDYSGDAVKAAVAEAGYEVIS
jgi:copper chaperone